MYITSAPKTTYVGDKYFTFKYLFFSRVLGVLYICIYDIFKLIQ